MTHRLVWSGLLGLGFGVLGSIWGSVSAASLTSVSVEVTGGDYGGVYKRDSPDTNCVVGSGGDDRWEATLGTDVPEPNGLSLFMLTTPHTGPEAGTTTDFSLFVGFGEYGDDGYTEYALEPAKGSGTGSLTLTQTDRKHAQLSVTGQTAEGVSLDATLICNDILDMSGRALRASEFGELDFAPDSASPTGSLELTIGDTTYAVKTGGEGSCTRGMAETGDLWYEYYAGEGHTDLLLMTNDVGGAKRGTSTFGFSIDLSPVHEPGDGGTLTVTENGDGLTLLVDAQTSDGTPVRVTAVCPQP